MQNINDSVSIEVQEAAAAGPESLQQANPKALKVCIMTADFWGLKSAGGTATAYHLLAAVLAKDPRLHVRLMNLTNAMTDDQALRLFDLKGRAALLSGKEARRSR